MEFLGQTGKPLEDVIAIIQERYREAFDNQSGKKQERSYKRKFYDEKKNTRYEKRMRTAERSAGAGVSGVTALGEALSSLKGEMVFFAGMSQQERQSVVSKSAVNAFIWNGSDAQPVRQNAPWQPPSLYAWAIIPLHLLLVFLYGESCANAITTLLMGGYTAWKLYSSLVPFEPDMFSRDTILPVSKISISFVSSFCRRQERICFSA